MDASMFVSLVLTHYVRIRSRAISRQKKNPGGETEARMLLDLDITDEVHLRVHLLGAGL